MVDKKLQFLQAFRAVAVTLAVLYHFPGGLTVSSTGYVGVDLFFVISGFIMVLTTSGLKDGPRDAIEFAIKRLCRIWPAYAIATIVMALAFLAMFGGSPYAVAQNVWRALVFYPIWVGGPVNQPGWTLVFEMMFYAALFISLFFRGARWLVFWTIAALSLVALPILATGKFQPFGPDYGFSADGGSAYLALVSNKIVWSFLIGVVIGKVFKTKLIIKSRALALALCLPGLVATAYMMYVVGRALEHGIWYGLSFGSVILPLSLTDKFRAIRVPTVFVFVGDMSYSIYVSHWLVAKPFYVLWRDGIYYASNLRTMAMLLIYIVLIMAVSVPMYYFVETRASNWLRTKILSMFWSSEKNRIGTSAA